MAGHGVDIKLGRGSSTSAASTCSRPSATSRAGSTTSSAAAPAVRRPGETRFYLSGEDDLVRLFAGDRIKGIMERFKLPDDQPMEAKILSNQIENAQKKVEEQNFVARKNVLKYDDVMNTQRTVIYERRRRVLDGDDLSEDVRAWIRETVEANIQNATEAEFNEDWDLAALVQQMQALYGTDITVEELTEEVELEREALIEEFVEGRARDLRGEGTGVRGRADARDRALCDPPGRRLALAEVPRLDGLPPRRHPPARDGARSARRVPRRGHAMFNDLRNTIREEVVLTLFHAQVELNEPQLEPEQGTAASSTRTRPPRARRRLPPPGRVADRARSRPRSPPRRAARRRPRRP